MQKTNPVRKTNPAALKQYTHTHYVTIRNALPSAAENSQKLTAPATQATTIRTNRAIVSASLQEFGTPGCGMSARPFYTMFADGMCVRLVNNAVKYERTAGDEDGETRRERKDGERRRRGGADGRRGGPENSRGGLFAGDVVGRGSRNLGAIFGRGGGLGRGIVGEQARIGPGRLFRTDRGIGRGQRKSSARVFQEQGHKSLLNHYYISTQLLIFLQHLNCWKGRKALQRNFIKFEGSYNYSKGNLVDVHQRDVLIYAKILKITNA